MLPRHYDDGSASEVRRTALAAEPSPSVLHTSSG